MAGVQECEGPACGRHGLSKENASRLSIGRCLRKQILDLESRAFEFIIVGQGSRFFEGRCVVERASKINLRLPVVVIARQLKMECYLEAMQLGAVDY